MNDAIINQNRDTACPGFLPRPAGCSCDEYPFASTYEGAAQHPFAGRTFQGCGLDPYLPAGRPGQGPGWSACMIDTAQNSSGGSDLGFFYQRERIIDGDAFVVLAYFPDTN